MKIYFQKKITFRSLSIASFSILIPLFLSYEFIRTIDRDTDHHDLEVTEGYVSEVRRKGKLTAVLVLDNGKGIAFRNIVDVLPFNITFSHPVFELKDKYVRVQYSFKKGSYSGRTIFINENNFYSLEDYLEDFKKEEDSSYISSVYFFGLWAIGCLHYLWGIKVRWRKSSD